MFKSYASKITSFLIENKEINQDDYEVYKYGFEVLIAFIVNIAIVLSIGLLFNKIFYSIAFLICYCPIRQFAGGYHANNYTKCLLIFILIFILTINTFIECGFSNIYINDFYYFNIKLYRNFYTSSN